jgi:hypothetical protein
LGATTRSKGLTACGRLPGGAAAHQVKVGRSLCGCAADAPDLCACCTSPLPPTPLQDTIHEPPASTVTMRKAVSASLVTTFVFYVGVGVTGYAALGDKTPGNILTGFTSPAALVTAANAMVLIHMCECVRMGEEAGQGPRVEADFLIPPVTCLAPPLATCYASRIPAYQVFSQPVFHMVETALAARIKAFRGGVAWPMRLALRSLYVIGTTAVACAMPFFSGGPGLGRGVGTSPPPYVGCAETCLLHRALQLHLSGAMYQTSVVCTARIGTSGCMRPCCAPRTLIVTLACSLPPRHHRPDWCHRVLALNGVFSYRNVQQSALAAAVAARQPGHHQCHLLCCIAAGRGWVLLADCAGRRELQDVWWPAASIATSTLAGRRVTSCFCCIGCRHWVCGICIEPCLPLPW